jgi:hypothetical protein
MPPALMCPKCKSTLSQFDIARDFECPNCKTALAATGWTAVYLFDALSLVIGVYVLAVAWAGLGWVGFAVTFVGLLAAELYVRRAFIKVEERSAMPDEQQAT